MSSRRGFSNTRASEGRAVADGFDDDELPEKVIQTPRSCSSGPVPSNLVEGLLEKRGDKREDTLASIIKGLNANISKKLLEEKFATFLYRCLNSVKKGSPKEVNDSYHVIGLLTTIVGCETKLSEIYRELLPVLSGALKSGHTTVKIFDCLAIVAFFGATNPDETENAMLIIWEYLNPESGYDVNTKNNSVDLLVAAIYAWLFFLSSMEGPRLSYTYWKGAISYFAKLLDHDNTHLVCGAACEALALIFETGSLEKFRNDEDGPNPSYTLMQQSLREDILERVNCAYSNLQTEKNAVKIRNVARYFEGSHVPTESIVVKGKVLTLSSWYQIIQLQFLKRFLANGFNIHMEENEKLQNLFEFNPRKNRNSGPELYVATTDKGNSIQVIATLVSGVTDEYEVGLVLIVDINAIIAYETDDSILISRKALNAASTLVTHTRLIETHSSLLENSSVSNSDCSLQEYTALISYSTEFRLYITSVVSCIFQFYK